MCKLIIQPNTKQGQKGGRVAKGAKKAVKKLAQYKQMQLPLGFVFPGPKKNRDYSNTIELYDAIPKYFWGRVQRIDGQFLKPLEREFRFRNEDYKVAITPARMKVKEGYRDYFPGQREELVEDALRKLASDGAGCLLDDQVSVIFSLYELQKELTVMGHTYSIKQIKDALLVCTKTHLQLESSDGRAILTSSVFETVGLSTRADWKGTGKKTRCFVRFNSLVTRSIRSQTFRQLNYKTCMSYKRMLARWLHKRMSHIYRQAAFNNSYGILLSTIIRDSGAKPYKQLRNNLRKVREALGEMKEKRVVVSYKEEKIMEHGRRRIIDVRFDIRPGLIFIQDIKRANKKHQKVLELRSKKQNI